MWPGGLAFVLVLLCFCLFCCFVFVVFFVFFVCFVFLVYFIGDMTLLGPENGGKLEKVLRVLPGRKVLVLGNHDRCRPFAYVEYGFESVHTSLDIGEWVLVHDPAVAVVARERRWLCGHVHG